MNTGIPMKGPTPPALTTGQTMAAIGMLERGDRQLDVAVWFQVSPSTINRAWQRKRKWKAIFDVPTDLPPRGPYKIVERAVFHETEAKAAIADEMAAAISQVLNKYRQLKE